MSWGNGVAHNTDICIPTDVVVCVKILQYIHGLWLNDWLLPFFFIYSKSEKKERNVFSYNCNQHQSVNDKRENDKRKWIFYACSHINVYPCVHASVYAIGTLLHEHYVISSLFFYQYSVALKLEKYFWRVSNKF